MTSLLQIVMSVSAELQKTVEDGYDHFLIFQDGNVLSELVPELMYPIAIVVKQPRPCHVLQSNIYRVVLPGGIKGFAVVSWTQDNDE